MRFKSFEIENFKGIAHAVLDLSPAGANISTLVGLNESGKTTILQAISSLAPHSEEKALYGNALDPVDPASLVPKHLKSNFTGSSTVTATLEFETGEREDIIGIVEQKTGISIDLSSIPEFIIFTYGRRFESSDPKEEVNTWNLVASGKVKRGKHYKPIEEGSAAWNILETEISNRIPEVVYFPTFLFSQPERVVLNPGKGEDPVNRLYRQIIQNVAQSLTNPLDVKKHIVDRIIVRDASIQNILAFWGLASDKQSQVNAALGEISEHLSKTIFESWSKIFGDTFSGREIVLRLGIDAKIEENPLVYLQFTLKDGTTQYDINERSLGFRWFFSFLIFTLYRVSAKTSHSTLFLLDEPASNLHSRAQLQLVGSFPKIAMGSNQIIYSTHSHYMINPDWLDQAFIVSNSAVDYAEVGKTDGVGVGRYTNIHVEKYRNFVGKHPDRPTYFQPVLDKLDVAPSRLDLVRPSVLVEGKGDYLILEYGRKVICGVENSFAVVPTRGATGLDELIGLFLGWAVPFVVCLDDDLAGRKARTRHIDEWGLDSSLILTLADVDSSLSDCAIEGFLEDEDVLLVANHYSISSKPSKSQIQLFFSEALASGNQYEMSKNYGSKVRKFESVMAAKLPKLSR